MNAARLKGKTKITRQTSPSVFVRLSSVYYAHIKVMVSPIVLVSKSAKVGNICQGRKNVKATLPTYLVWIRRPIDQMNQSGLSIIYMDNVDILPTFPCKNGVYCVDGVELMHRSSNARRHFNDLR